MNWNVPPGAGHLRKIEVAGVGASFRANGNPIAALTPSPFEGFNRGISDHHPWSAHTRVREVDNTPLRAVGCPRPRNFYRERADLDGEGDADVVMRGRLRDEAEFRPQQKPEGAKKSDRDLEALDARRPLSLPPRAVVIPWPATPAPPDRNSNYRRCDDHGCGDEPEDACEEKEALEAGPHQRQRGLRQDEGDDERKTERSSDPALDRIHPARIALRSDGGFSPPTNRAQPPPPPAPFLASGTRTPAPRSTSLLPLPKA